MDQPVAELLNRPVAVPPGQPMRVAVYSRLADGIRRQVLPPGSVLPNEPDLCVALGVSRTVVREALMLLEEDGLVRNRRGIGRFVATSLPRVGLEQVRPYEQVFGDEHGGVEVRRVRTRTQATTDFVSAALGLPDDVDTWFVESVLVRDGEPVALVQEHLPAGRQLADVSRAVADVVAQVADGPGTLLASLVERLGPVLDAGECELVAGVPGDSRAALLDVGPEDPVLVLTQVARHGDRPLYLAKVLVPPRAGHLRVVQSVTG
ncbi:GntR family transcriptional regulator [Isoptericola sp. BMS4]|uniref:GntR family transcriptional regulator n=1 Tax=Isoptericola sp. BMS4 TaxID=2527875 RepID=UPI001F114789|nr:GntR family transcriptional regulator [Isoptericola sp. BMS4]